MDPAAMAAWSDDQLDETIGQVGALESAVRRTLLELVGELERRESWPADGATSAADWLVYRLGYSRATARELVRVAHALEVLPAIAEAFAEGRLSWEQVRALSRFATPATDAELAASAGGQSVAALERLARRARPVDPEVDAEAKRTRTLRWSYDHARTTLRFRGRLPAADGATFVAEIERRAESKGPDSVTGVWEPFDMRAADALAELASEHLAADQGRDPDRATVVVHADLDTITGGTDLPAEVETGTVLSRAALDRLLCDARMQLIAEDDAGNPVIVTRTKRTVPAWLSRELRDRDRTCRFPGCSRIGFLHAHHVVYYRNRGPTEAANLVLLCWHHHDLVHRPGWHVSGDANGVLVFRRPDGRVLMPGPPRLRPEIRERVLVPH